MDSDSVASMGQVLAVIVTVSLALTQAIGPLVMYITEAIKATGKVKEGWSGLVALVVGVSLGAGLGWLTDAFAAENYDRWSLVGVGAFAGALMAAGAIKTYKAVSQVNVQATPAVVITGETMSTDEGEIEPTTMAATAVTQADIDAMDAELARHGPLAEDESHMHVMPAPPLPAASAPFVTTAEDTRK
jgi:pimeloyl-ACP methyl ester carboxylesterase